MKISDLVNRVEPFCFDFDGLKLEGTYYKYRTTVPTYLESLGQSVPNKLDTGTDEELKANADAIETAKAEIGFRLLADTIITWDVEDEEGNPLPFSMETFKCLPDLFSQKFVTFIRELREGNPTNGNGSPTG